MTKKRNSTKKTQAEKLLDKESQPYDKIFKENIEELIIPFAGKLLNINPKNLREILDDL